MATDAPPAGPPRPSDDLPADAPPGLRAAADGDELQPGEERGALDWLLGQTLALEYDIPVRYETPDGLQTLTFHVRQVDPKVIDGIDAKNRTGDGPFAKLDVPTFNAELALEATVYIEDEKGRRTNPRSDEFRGGVPSPVLAMLTRFKFQGGLLEGIAEQVRTISGYGSDRVGTAQRAVVEAGKRS